MVNLVVYTQSGQTLIEKYASRPHAGQSLKKLINSLENEAFVQTEGGAIMIRADEFASAVIDDR